jgi:hypothetical protein
MWEPTLADAHVFAPSPSDLRIDRAILGKVLGYESGGTPEVVHSLIDRILPDVPARIAIQCGFRILPAGSLTVSDDSFSCGGTLFSSGSIISKQLGKSSTLALFLATIGPKLEEWSKELMAEGDVLRAYIVDAIASETVEQVAEWLENKIGERAQELEWKITNRYSPGYCGWSVAEQHKLFSLLPDGFCGVSLTPSALMIPIKSVSGIIGLGPDVKRGAYQCSICDLKDCFRRTDEPGTALDEP